MIVLSQLSARSSPVTSYACEDVTNLSIQQTGQLFWHVQWPSLGYFIILSIIGDGFGALALLELYWQFSGYITC